MEEIMMNNTNMEEMRVDNQVRLTKVHFGSGDDYIVVSGNDASLYKDFLDARDKFLLMAKDLEEKEKDIKGKYSGGSTDFTREDEDKIYGLKVTLAEETAKIMDGIFGEGTTRKFWGDVYAARPNFIPDVEAIMDYFDALSPVIERMTNHKVDLVNLASKQRMAKYQPRDYKKPQNK